MDLQNSICFDPRRLLQSEVTSSCQKTASQTVVLTFEEVNLVVSDLNELWNCDGDIPLLGISAKEEGHVQLTFLWMRTKTPVTSTNRGLKQRYTARSRSKLFGIFQMFKSCKKIKIKNYCIDLWSWLSGNPLFQITSNCKMFKKEFH